MGSVVSSLTGKQQRVQFIQNPTGTVIVLDACVQETHSRESPPTEFEIEDGQTVSDNIVVKPFSLEIQGVISDTPLSALASALTTAAGVALPSAGLVGASVGINAARALFPAIAESESPSVNAYLQLLSLQENKQPFDVLTTLRRYKNMWIKSISVPRDSQTGQVLLFTVSLVELLLVSPVTVNLQIFKDSDLAADFANQGRQEMIDPAAAKAFKAGENTALTLTGAK